MNILTLIFACFALIGAVDSVTGNHLKLGPEFEKGIQLAGTVILAMLGILCLTPVISDVIAPVIVPVCEFLHIDPSVIPGMLIANDMGAAPLARELSNNALLSGYNGLVMSSMMGCTITFTIPTALRMVKKEQHPDALLGILCGISTVPVGCFVSGLVAKIPLITLLIDLIPLLIFAGIIILGLLKAPGLSVKIMNIFGKLIFALITVGLGLAIFRCLTDFEILKGMAPAQDYFEMLFELIFCMAGVFPLVKVVSFLLKRPLGFISKKIGINETASLGLITTLASSTPVFGMTQDMNRKGVILNLAFSVSAAFILSDHLVYTMMFDKSFVPAMVAGKLAAGITSLFIANFIAKKGEQ